MPQKTNITLDAFPKLVEEWHPIKNLENKPKDYAQFSNKKVWWKCENGPDHEWESSVESRTKRKQNCPFCVNMRVSITNRLDLKRPDLVKEWHYKKNNIKPNSLTVGSNKKVWWNCSDGHEWESKVADRVQRGFGCKDCGNKVTSKNSTYEKGDWIETNFEILSQWDHAKNTIYGNPTDFKSSSSKKVWWKCENGPDHEWEAEIRKRVLSNTGCPYCNGKKVSVTNSFLILHPEIAKEWHPTKNFEKEPKDFAQFSGKKVWWKCENGPDHEWEAVIARRSRDQNSCPYCSGLKVSITNNLELNAPEIAKQFDLEKNHPKLPSDFSTGSNESVWWKCDIPEHRGWQAPIAARMRQSIGCYICNQEERFANESRLFEIVKDLYPEHKVERAIRPKWLEGLEIDIFVPSLNLAIEYQGRQHYEAIDFFGGEKGFEKRLILDEKKRKLLKEFNINLLEWKYTVEMTKQRVKKEIDRII